MTKKIKKKWFLTDENMMMLGVLILIGGNQFFFFQFKITIMWSDKYGRRINVPVGPIIAIYLDFFPPVYC